MGLLVNCPKYGDKISPLPVDKHGFPSMKNGTSLPKDAAISLNSILDKGRPNNLFIALSVAAASLLPPPRPAPKGMFFSNSTLPLIFMLKPSSKTLIAL